METIPTQPVASPSPTPLTSERDMVKIFTIALVIFIVCLLVGSIVVLRLRGQQSSSSELLQRPSPTPIFSEPTVARIISTSGSTPTSGASNNQNITVTLFPGSQEKGAVPVPSSADTEYGYVVSAEPKAILQYYADELEKRGLTTNWKQIEQVWQIYPDQFKDGIAFQAKSGGITISVFTQVKKDDQGQTNYAIIAPPQVTLR